MKHRFSILTGSTFYSSYLIGIAPGTSTSIVVFALLYFFPLPSVITLVLIGIVVVLHFLSFDAFSNQANLEDPPHYTLDETLAILILHLQFPGGYLWLVGFPLFRFFDIVKPLGIGAMEKITWLSPALKNLADDLLAMAYTFVLLLLLDYAF